MSETDVGREPLQIVELEQVSCGLAYGNAPCTAAVGTTGTRKCFNTRQTCQDPDNFSPSLGVNIAANPGFESGDTLWAKGTGWTIINDANARTGAWVARKTPGADNTLRNTGAGIVPVSPGDTMIGKAWAKASGTTDGTCRVQLHWLKADLSDATPALTSGTITPLTASYQELTVQGDAPSDAAFCRLQLSPGSVIATDTVYVDDTELRRADPHRIVWRFVKPAAVIPRDLFEVVGPLTKTNPIPTLMSVSTSPTRINIGGGGSDSSPLGRRANVQVVLQDAPWDDSIGDKYLSEREYVPFDLGSFWSKWLARNPFHARFVLRVIEGYAEQTLDEMQTRVYLVDRINGPDSSGRVTITAKDPLRLADDKRTQFPRVSNIALVGAIDASQTTLIEVLALETELTDTFGNTGSTRYLRIGDEILRYTGYSNTGTNEWTLSGVVRGALGSTASTHAADDKCQRVGRFEDLEVWLIAKDLLLNHTEVDPDFIDDSQWDDEGNRFLSPFVLTGTVAEPTAVSTLLGELVEQCPFYMWWDEREQLIPIRAVRPPMDDGVRQINERDHIMKESIVLTEDPDQRISRIFLYYRQRDPTRALRDVGNFDRVQGRIDGDAESADQHGEIRVRQIFSRWLTTAGQAIHTTVRVLNRFRDQVRFLSFKVDAKDRDISVADVLQVTVRAVVDDTGADLSRRWQVISAEEVIPGEVVRYDLQEFTMYGRFWVWADEAAPDYDVATEAQREANAYWADDDGVIENGEFGYQWT